MDAQRIADITAALRDLLGPYVAYDEGREAWIFPLVGWGEDACEFGIYSDEPGLVFLPEYKKGRDLIPAETIDTLQQASAIVRKMSHA